MKSEDEPVSDDEWLIRLVWKDRVTSRTPIISKSSFQPRDDETSGISFFRRACLQDPSDALNGIHPEKRRSYALVLVSVRLIRSLPLTIRPDRIAEAPGHVLIPEINPGAYKANKPRLEATFLVLAKEASENIIRRPPA